MKITAHYGAKTERRVIDIDGGDLVEVGGAHGQLPLRLRLMRRDGEIFIAAFCRADGFWDPPLRTLRIKPEAIARVYCRSPGERAWQLGRVQRQRQLPLEDNPYRPESPLHELFRQGHAGAAPDDALCEAAQGVRA